MSAEPTATITAGREGRGRRAAKAAILLVLAVVWVRVVLFAWVYPAVERVIDNPELRGDQTEAPVQPATPAG